LSPYITWEGEAYFEGKKVSSSARHVPF
jgi:hypothetical protein